MAVRQATRRFRDWLGFIRDWDSTFKLGAIFLPAGSVDGEPASDMQIDVVVPDGSRIGPIACQLVNRMPDGSVALRFAEAPPELAAARETGLAALGEVRDWLAQTGQVLVFSPGVVVEVRALQARVQELEQALARAEQARVDALRVAASSRPAEGALGPGKDATAETLITGLRVPDLSSPPAAEGELAGSRLRAQMMALAVERATGVLTLHLTDGSIRWGFWSRGGVVAWKAEPLREDEVLGVLLFRANQISKEQLSASVALMEQRGIRQGEALIELGVLTFAQLVLMLQRQAEFILQQVMAETSGRWTWHPLADLPERFVAPPVRVAAFLFRALRQRAKEVPTETINEFVRPLLDRYLFIKPGVERAFEEMRLSNEEQGFIKIVEATSYRLRELSAVSNLTRSATSQMVWVLDQLALVDFRASGAEKRVQDQVARLLQARKAVLAKGTFFDRLELHWICTARDVAEAWRRVNADFPAGEPDKYGVEWRDTVAELRKGLEEAYMALKDDARRREYRSGIIERTMVVQSAQMLAGKGDLALLKGANQEALECLSKAVELEPGSATYRAALARAEAAATGR